jgi:hypothetical protein
VDRRIHQLAQVEISQIPNLVLRTNKMVARVHGSIVFNDEHSPAGGGHPTQVGDSIAPDQCRLREELHVELSNVVVRPLVEL